MSRTILIYFALYMNGVPKKRKSNGRKKRLSIELSNSVEAMKIGESDLFPAPVSRCVREFLKRKGRDCVQRTEDNKVRIWRIK